MTTHNFIVQLQASINKIHIHLRDLAPKDSKYVGVDNFKPVDFIYVNNNRVYTNSNTLWNSVSLRENRKGVDLIYDTYVPGSAVPYYEKVVYNKTITRAYHYGRLEYGDVRYRGNEVSWKNSMEQEVPNRNYMYYQKAESFIKAELIGRYDGLKIEVSENIKEWEIWK